MSLKPDQYLTFRIAGDPEFSKGTYTGAYIYAWDGNGNFGRWAATIPQTTNWQIMNIRVGTMAGDWQGLQSPIPTPPPSRGRWPFRAGGGQ